MMDVIITEEEYKKLTTEHRDRLKMIEKKLELLNEYFNKGEVFTILGWPGLYPENYYIFNKCDSIGRLEKIIKEMTRTSVKNFKKYKKENK